MKEPIESPIQREDTVFGFEEDFVVLCSKHGIPSYFLVYSEKPDSQEGEFGSVASARVTDELIDSALELAEDLRDLEHNH